MSEEKAAYITTENKMRRALIEAKSALVNAIDRIQSGIPEYEDIFKMIDEALNVDYDNYTPKQVQKMLRDAFEEGKEDRDIEITSKIFELPEQIKEQTRMVVDMANSIEKLRISTENSRLQALEIVINLKEGDKPKYSNDKARKIAQERLLSEDKLYLENCDALARQEYRLKIEQIELDYLHNLFRAYLAIAGMQGVKS